MKWAGDSTYLKASQSGTVQGSRRLSSLRNALRLGSKLNSPPDPRLNTAALITPLECQERSKCVQAPPDVWFLIADHLDKFSLASLIRTCRYFHQLLEINLYRHVYARLSIGRALRLFQTLEERQDLIPYISKYEGPVFPPEMFTERHPKRTFLDQLLRRNRVQRLPPIAPLNETPGFKSAMRLFTNAINIVDLSLYDYRPWGNDSMFDPVTGAIYNMSLRRLDLWGCSIPGAVLRNQPELEELALGSPATGLEHLGKDELQNLRKLKSSASNAACLVPGRPIKELYLLPSADSFDEKHFECFGRSSHPIKTLEITFTESWADEYVCGAIRVVARYLPLVERLTVMVDGPISGHIILQELPALSSIRSLSLLDVRLTTAEDQGSLYLHDPDDSPESDGIMRALF
ncbi:hypothetical protein FRB90_007005 [Tulasnella sp. 427]|nr:hypothetical protein FRB90_007005 [Tulasnella sp. 427]